MFDWQVVIPAMQDLFAELDAIRRRADPAKYPPIPAAALPVAPSPMDYFAAFPTERLPKARQFRWSGTTTVPVTRMLALRDYPVTKRIFETPEDVARVADALAARGGATAAEIAAELNTSPLKVERCLLWLMKYDYAEGETS
jgi:hypothetical protein